MNKQVTRTGRHIVGVDPIDGEVVDSSALMVRVGLGDEAASHVPTHITLVPPVEVDEGDLSTIEKHLSEVASDVPSYEILLRGTGTFRPVSEVVFVMLATGISQCEQLAELVREGPLDRPLNFPYHPHVTVAHDLPDDVLDRAFEDLSGYRTHFDVTEFWLYVHSADSGWTPTQAFTLG